MLRKVTALAILIAVVLAAFPTTGVLATGVTAKNLEDKWDQYVKAVDNMNFVHNKIDAKVDKWLSAHKDAKSDVRTHLTNDLIAYHTNLSAAKAIIQERAGFNAKGKVTDVAAANKSVDHLYAHLTLLRPAWHELRDLDGHFQH
jgi:hypothetical protein